MALYNQSVNSSEHILSLADQCVKCGLCLPQCPTYTLSANENESPRGRIALIQGWLSGQLEASAVLTQHLDHCLLCRRCERICPSQVPYAEILDLAKARLKKDKPSQVSFKNKILQSSLKILINETYSHYLFGFIRWMQKLSVLNLANKTGLLSLFKLKRITSYLPTLKKPNQLNDFYAAKMTPATGQVTLFTGCLSKNLEPETITASINLLTRLGFDVNVPKQQTCCGALHLHDGDIAQAEKLSTQNISVFNHYAKSTVISLVNGCSSQLKEYPQLNTKAKVTNRTLDIIEFLSEIDWPEEIQFKPLEHTVALQLPCSLQNVLRAEDKLLALLQRIPGIDLPPENIHRQCCGAAGSYFLKQPQISQQLQAAAFKNLSQSSPDFIISSNIGCALQLGSAIEQKMAPITVIHPIKLLEQQLLKD